MKEKLKPLAACLRLKPALLYFLLVTLLQLSFSLQSAAQSVTVTGSVRDLQGKGMPGVSVKVKGTTSGTVTDENGVYTITVPSSGSVLEFSSVGFLAREERVGSRSTINTSLNTASNNLDEVVVVGYGTQRKRDVTGAITSVTSKQIEERQAINLQDALQGQVAGLLVINDAGEPGAEGSITIRGGSTFSSAGNAPLYVIDGVVGANPSNLNPNDIQSIEVLKDAASGAIYGTRGANGVIIITTKRGISGKPRIDGRYLHSWGNLAHKLRQANATEVRMFRQQQGSSGLSTDSLNPGNNVDNDYQDALLTTAQKSQYDISISGANQGFNYYNSIRYVDDKGLVLNSWAKSFFTRTNLDFNFSKSIKWGTRLQLNYRKRNNISEGNTVNQTFQRPTNYRLILPDGTLAGYISGRRNPLAIALLDVDLEESMGGSLFNQLEAQIIKPLKFTANFNIDYTNGRDLSLSPKFNNSDGITNTTSETSSRSYRWQTQTFLNYNQTFKGDHRVDGLLGFSAERFQRNSLGASGRNLATEEIISLTTARVFNVPSQSISANTTASVFGRAGYGYKGRYNINGTLRYDGSSRFGVENRWGLFPAISAGWRISEERFMDFARGTLSDARFRASYGKTGNDGIGDYEARLLYNTGSFYNGQQGVSLPTRAVNVYLAWEENIQTNFGLDLSFFKNRVTTSFDYYIKTTTDLLYNRPIPRETGFETQRLNIGSFETKGFEISLNAIPIAKKALEWNVITNFTKYRGIVKSLAGDESFISGNTGEGGSAGWLIKEGNRIGDFYGWKALNVYAYNESNAYNENWERLTPVFNSGVFQGYTFQGKPYTGTVQSIYSKGAKLRAGDTEFVNYTKDSVIDDKDRMILGNAQPDFFAALINTVRYKNFSLSFTVNTAWGFDIYNNAARTLDDYGTSNIIPRPQTIYGMWRKPGDVTNVPPYSSRNDRGSMRMNSRWMEDGSYIRLSYLKFTYALPGKLAKRAFAQGANAYIYGSNLITWTNYSWYDPEFSSGDPLQPGQDSGRYPRRREYGIGVNLTF